MIGVEILSILAVIVYILYKFLVSNYGCWKKQGVTYVEPSILVGTNGPILSGKISFPEFVRNVYERFQDQRFVGLFDFRDPVLLVRDPDIIRQITIKDFDHFPNHKPILDTTNDIISGRNLFFLKDQEWRDVRTTLSPAFTSSKMKNMFAFVDKCGDQLVKYVEEKLQNKTENVLCLEAKDLFTHFTNDVIASAAFGIEVNSLAEPDHEFYKRGKSLTDVQTLRVFMIVQISRFFPYLAKKLGLTVCKKEDFNFFHSLVHDTIRTREEKSIVRQDMIHLLMLARKGKLTDNGEPISNHSKLINLTDEDLTAQVAIFFIAGFDTASTFLSFAVYELAMNPEIQEKLFDEIEAVIEEDDGQLTYNGVLNKMVYLDMVCNESLRKWPPVFALDRVCSKQYIIPETETSPSVTLEPNHSIMLPVMGLHYDPQYYPEPEKFDPERFNPDNKGNIKPFTFLPFGIGPRSCIGNRFALMAGKVSLVYLVRNFKFEVTSKTQIPLQLKKSSQVIFSERGIWFGVKKR